MTPHSSLLSAAEVAEMMSVHPATVRKWVDAGYLAAIELPSGLLRFRREDVEAILVPVTRKPQVDDPAVAS